MSSKLTAERSEMPDEASPGQVIPTDPSAEAAAALPALLGGPYRAPDVWVDDRLWCEYRKRKLVVSAFSSGPIRWPLAQFGGVFSSILYGDLVRAVQLESSRTVQAWWGTSETVVRRWRASLGIVSRLRRGPHNLPIQREWTAEEDALLGTVPDAALATLLGCEANLVWRRRRELEVAHYQPEVRQVFEHSRSRLVMDKFALKQHRETAWLSIEELAALAKLDAGFYRTLESGRAQSLERERAKRLARTLDCSLDDIASAREKKAAPRPVKVPISGKRQYLPHFMPLRFGPYEAPQVQEGEVLFCSLRQRELTVVDWSEGSIPWPRARVRGHFSLIVCGDLEKALRVESYAAVARVWGLSRQTVSLWRRALSIEGVKSPPKGLRFAPALGESSAPLESRGWPVNRGEEVLEATAGLEVPLHDRYRAPDVRVGDWLWCEFRQGEAEVQTFSSGPIPWPCVRLHGIDSLIVCGDLARAVRLESSNTVQELWSIGPTTVWKWRRVLGVRAAKEASRQSRRAKAPKKQPAKRSDPLAPRQRKASEFDRSRSRQWSPGEDKQLGTMPDTKLASQLGCSVSHVASRRRALGIAPHVPERGRPRRLRTSWLLVDTPRLRKRRVSASLTCKELARLAGVNYSHYCLLERGGHGNCELATLERIARVLECTVEDIALAPVQGARMPSLVSQTKADSALPVLLHGRYVAPDVRLGDRIWCEYRRGEVVVEKFSSGPVRWPCVRGGRDCAYILCGELVQAVRLESSKAVQAWWRVDASTVGRWRRVLGVEPINEGTRQLMDQARKQVLGSSGGGAAKVKQPRPFAAGWQKIRKSDSAFRRDWTAEEEKLLGTMSDSRLASRLGCSKGQVWRRRHELDVAAYLPEGRQPPKPSASRLVMDTDRLKQCREAASFNRKELAKLAGLNYVHYCTLENGFHATFERDTAERIARILDCSVEDIAPEFTPPQPATAKSIYLKDPAQVNRWRPGGPLPRKKIRLSRNVPLRFGPYHAPRVQVGDVLYCSYRGREFVVADWTEGPISWPCALFSGTPSIIVCGDLENALRQETAAAIASTWEVSRGLVTTWRRALSKGPSAIVRSKVQVHVPRAKAKVPRFVPLRHGPYSAPDVQVGDKLFCNMRGREMTVAHWSDGAIPWPRTQIGGNLSIILCGDLEAALQAESTAAIACSWEVSTTTVKTWRAALRTAPHSGQVGAGAHEVP